MLPYFTVCPNKSGSLLSFLKQQQSRALACRQPAPNSQTREGRRKREAQRYRERLEGNMEVAHNTHTHTNEGLFLHWICKLTFQFDISLFRKTNVCITTERQSSERLTDAKLELCLRRNHLSSLCRCTCILSPPDMCTHTT